MTTRFNFIIPLFSIYNHRCNLTHYSCRLDDIEEGGFCYSVFQILDLFIKHMIADTHRITIDEFVGASFQYTVQTDCSKLVVNDK